MRDSSGAADTETKPSPTLDSTVSPTDPDGLRLGGDGVDPVSVLVDPGVLRLVRQFGIKVGRPVSFHPRTSRFPDVAVTITRSVRLAPIQPAPCRPSKFHEDGDVLGRAGSRSGARLDNQNPVRGGRSVRNRPSLGVKPGAHQVLLIPRHVDAGCPRASCSAVPYAASERRSQNQGSGHDPRHQRMSMAHSDMMRLGGGWRHLETSNDCVVRGSAFGDVGQP